MKKLPFAVLAFDVGGTHLRMGRVNEHGQLDSVDKFALPSTSPEVLIDFVVREVERFEKTAKVGGVALGVAAHIDGARGYVYQAPNLGWRDLAMSEKIESRISLPVKIENDVNAAVLGETQMGSLSGCQDVLAVFVGTGVGAGALSSGALLTGAKGVALELGHIKVASPENGALCGCGERGCLEAYTSGIHLDRLAREAGLGVEHGFSARSLERAINNGSGEKLVETMSNILAQGIGAAVTLLNPQALLLGGGVFDHSPGYLTRVRALLPRYIAAPARRNLRVVTPALEYPALLGAAALFVDVDGRR